MVTSSLCQGYAPIHRPHSKCTLFPGLNPSSVYAFGSWCHHSFRVDSLQHGIRPLYCRGSQARLHGLVLVSPNRRIWLTNHSLTCLMPMWKCPYQDLSGKGEEEEGSASRIWVGIRMSSMLWNARSSASGKTIPNCVMKI